MRFIRALLLAVLILSVPAAPVRAQSACFGDTYVVQPGDTLFSISQTCRIPYAGLVGINVELSDPNLIWPGQVIRLRAGVRLSSAPAGGLPEKGGLDESGQVYFARRGDSLARIAYLYHTTVAELRLYNPKISDSLVIQIGQRIQMPPDARRTPGWAGVSTRVARPGEEIEIRVIDFPPYADIDINLGELFRREEGDYEVFYYVTFDAQTDARGRARVNVRLPFFAWIDEEWIVEVVATEQDPVIRAMTPGILIDYY